MSGTGPAQARLVELRRLLAQRAEVSDVELVEHLGADGQRHLLAGVVPVASTAPADVRRAVTAAALEILRPHEPPLSVVVLTSIPRTVDGRPDERALTALPVASAAGAAVVRAPGPVSVRLHLEDLLDLPSRWAGERAESDGPDAGVEEQPPPSARPARSAGGVLVEEADDPPNLTEALLRNAELWPQRGLRLVEADGTRMLTYPELLDAARRTLTGLRARGLNAGDPVMLHSPSLADHFIGLWACLLGGMHPVTVAQAPGYQSRNATLDKLEHAWRTLSGPPVLSSGATVAALRRYAEVAGLADLRVLDLADHRDGEPAEDLHHGAAGEVAALQLSSGSTNRSKVIPLTHRGIVRYAQGARQVGRLRAGDVTLNWLPLDHVGGQVMWHLGPMILGCTNVHAATPLVLADPLLWLDLLERHGVQHSWSPNFGFKLVTDALRRHRDRSWDLRHVRGLMNAGEQCTEPVMRQFAEALGPFGISARTVLLAWGMAETCTAISYQEFGPQAVQHARLVADGTRVRLLAEAEPGSTALLSMGPAAPGSEFRVAGRDGTTALPELSIGRLQVQSDRVTPGYLHNEEANRAAFPGDGWFDTGDLAFIADGRLTITGRGKEIIIVNGVHHLCHEIEDVVGEVDGVAVSWVAAIGAPARGGTERMVVLFVPDRDLDAALVGRVRQELAQRLQITSATLIAVDRQQFEKTTSGKIQRAAMRARLLAGGYDEALRTVEIVEGGPETVPDCVYRPSWEARQFPTGPRPATDGPTLVIADSLGLAEAVGELLPGAELVRPGPDGSRTDHWLALLDGLRAADRTPARIVFAASYLPTPDPADPEAPERATRVCGEETLALVQALANTGWTGELVTLSRGLYRINGTEPGCYPAALAAALGETIALEQPQLRAWHLDLPGTDPRADAEVVVAGLGWIHREAVIAWRDTALVRILRRSGNPHDGATGLRPGSRWLVTGGLGGVARAVLGDLVAEFGLRLLIVGRTPADRRAEALAELAEHADGPGRPRYAQVDITDPIALEAAVAEAERDWSGGLDGVLHLAGEYELGPLAQITPRQWRALTAAKVDGSLAVAQVLARRKESRLVAFSSLLTVMPVVGAGAYVAANRFLEALCDHLAGHTQVQCLTWALWRGIGVSAAHGDLEQANRRHMLALSTNEGRALVRLVLGRSAGQLLVGIDPAAARVRGLVRPGWPLEVATGADEADAVGEVSSPGPAIRDLPQRDSIGVAHAVRTVLGQVVPGGIDERVPFYDAGLDSVRLLRLHTLLQQAIGHEFPQTALFSHPTPAALVGYLNQHLGAATTAGSGGPAPTADPRIAIIGMAMRFPGADTIEQYWDNLLDGRVSVRRFGRDELLAAGLPARLVDDPDFVPVSGALADIAGFDAELFGISAKEAALMDPQHRLFLQICHEALEHGGYAGTDRRVGVYAGTGMHLYSLRNYLFEQLADTDPADQLAALQVTIGNQPDFLVTRVAYRLGLTGPAMTVQTACSTSLVAVHLAVRSLLAGEAELALAGAAAVHVPRIAGYRYQEGSILSRTGVCRAFDAGADGTVGGNGVAAVLLKRLDDALTDGDTVHAVILGSAVNNDGADKSGYTAPSVTGHARVIREALSAGGVEPSSVGYLETHGTGTRIGDPIEVEALRTVFGDRTRPLPLGAVKSNIGHLDTCSGMAGLIKAVLAVQHGQIPPLAGLTEPNPQLRLSEGPFRLPTSPQPWPVSGRRRAGISSLGVGGTNAHVVIEEAPPRPAVVATAGRVTVPLSAQSPTALAELATRMAARLDTPDRPAPADLLLTLGTGRRRLRHRLVAWAEGAESAATALRDHAARGPGSVPGQRSGAGWVAGSVATGGTGPVVFALTGQGVDCAGAAAGLMEYEPARQVLERCGEQYRQTWGTSLLEPMLGAPHEWTTATVQPALFVLQVAMARLLEAVGVHPDVLIGHSAGEYAALCLGGALSLEDGLYLTSIRGRLMRHRSPEGAAVAVLGDEAAVREALDRVPGLELVVRNGPANHVLAGTPETVRLAREALDRAGVGYRPLAVQRAFHSSLVEPVLDELAGQAATLRWQPLRIPVVTSLGGTRLAVGIRLGAEHVRRHTREVADYRAGVDGLVADGCTTFVELGPDATLSGLGRQWPDTTWTPMQPSGVDRSEAVIAALGSMFCRGIDVDWAALSTGGRRVPLPTYPFQLSPHWTRNPTPPSPASGGSPAMSPALPRVPADDAQAVVLQRVRELTARHLGEEPDRIPADAAFFDLGADSLLMINMLRELEIGFGVRVAMRELFEELDTPERLSAVIVARMDPTRIAGMSTVADSSVEAVAEVRPTPPVVAAADPVADPVADPAADSLVRSQLDLMARFTQLMSEQLTALSGRSPNAPPTPLPPPPLKSTVEPRVEAAGATVQLGPRPLGPVAGMGSGRLDERQRAHLDDLVRRYTARTATSKRLAQAHRRRLADSRAVVGFRRATKEMLYPIAARRAHGAYLQDVDANTYVDITMGFGALLFGHEPEFLSRAVRDFLDSGLRLGPRSEETGAAAELLCDLTGMDRAAFSATGTEANSAAFRLARAFTGRDVIVTFEGAYHGHIDPVLSRTIRDETGLRTVPVSAGIPDSAVADVLVLPYDNQESLEVIARDAARIAAVVVEPVPSRYPDRQPVEFVRALRDLCDRHGIVLMFDEMLTGFRPHPRGAQGVFGVRADLVTYGKVIGGGFPIGAITGHAGIMDWIDGGFWRYGDDSVPEQDTTFFGGTYIQHPVSMVAAKAVLTELRERGPSLQEGLNRRTADLAGTLNDFFVAEEFPLRVHHFGSLFRFASTANLDLLFHHLLLAGVHVWEWRNFFLSDAHTDADVTFIADAVRESLHELRAGGFLPPGSGRPVEPRPARSTQPRPTPMLPAQPRPTPALPALVRPTATTATAATGRLDFSLYFFGDYPLEQAGDRYTAILRAAEFADTHDLHAVWLPERHFDSFGGIFPNPSVLAAAIAARTTRVRLHAGCVVLPLHDPIRVAEEWSMVDNISGGRVGLGCASGWHARDFVLAPTAYGRHRDTMYEGIEDIRTLWRGDPIERVAGNGERVEIRLFPKPIQEMPPFYTAVIGNPDSYRRAAAAGLGVITNLMSQSVEQLAENITRYRAARAEHGLDPAGGRVVLLLHTFLGEHTDRVREEAYGPFCDYLRSSLALFGQVTNSLGVTIDLANTPAEDVDFLLRRAYQRYCTDRALIGSPADCAPLVARFAELGVDEIGCFIDFGLPAERMIEGLSGIERLRDTVDPSTRVTTALTEAQRQIWVVDRMFPGRPTYHESKVVLLEGELDVPALRVAFGQVMARHPALRSVFPEIDGEPRQVVAPQRPVDLPVLDASGSTPAEAARDAVAQETAHGFDLATGPLFEPRLIRLDPRRQLLVLRMHHLVVDTVSAEILSREIATCYAAAVRGVVPDLAEPPAWPLPVAGTDVDRERADLAYWVELLERRPPRLAIPTDRPRPPQPSGTGGVVSIQLDADLTGRVKEFGRRHRVTTFMVLLAAFATTLARLSGQRDFVIGTPAAHRPEGTEAAVGLFINTLPLRLQVPDEACFADLVRAARSVVLGAQEHQDIPFPRIVRALGGEPDPTRPPIFDVVIEFDNGAVFELNLPGVRATLLDAAVERAPFDLALFLTNLGDTVRCQIDYAADLFDPATVRRILEQLRLVLDTGIAAPQQPLAQLPRLTEAESRQLTAWQDGGPAPEVELLPGVAPGHRGPVCDDLGQVDGPELDRRTEAVAAALTGIGVGPGQLVGVHLPRSTDAVVAMLGVLRVGAGYVPLDPEQPTARSATIAVDARVSAVVSRSAIPALPLTTPTVLMDRLDQTPVAAPVAVSPVDIAPDDIAYVLFTSGSTGRPKGCVIEHRAIANTIAWYVRDLAITAADRLSWFGSPGFDISCVEVWPALRVGASLHVVPEDVRLDPVRLREWLVATAITIAVVPTPVGELLLDLDWSGGEPAALRRLVVGGDRLRRGGVVDLPFQVTNLYGPTEATVVSTWAHLVNGAEGAPPIGRPVPGTWVRVLDEQGQPVGVGVPGELYLGGAQLARGYLSAPQETAQRFVRHPEHGPAFRTGDVVRWRDDGQLEFLRRLDQQVQIRGFRVEPGEVEYHLRGLDGVREAAVRAWTDPDGDVYLAGYVVPTSPAVEVGALTQALAGLLPDYLIPGAWMLLPELPLTDSGKLDRAALPRPSGADHAVAGTLVAPASALEHRLHDIWCGELGLTTVSVESTFTELGGHSLAAIRLLNRVRTTLGNTVQVLDFFRAPTIRGMARLLADSPSPVGNGSGNGGAATGDPVRVRGTL